MAFRRSVGYIPFAGDCRTPDEFHEYLRHLLEDQKGQVMQMDEFIANEESVVMLGRYAASVIPNNKQMVVATVHLFGIQAGKVTRFLCFADTAKVADDYQVCDS